MTPLYSLAVQSNFVGVSVGQSVKVGRDNFSYLETQNHLRQEAFAARKVHSRHTKENVFVIVEDWTPNSPEPSTLKLVWR